MTISNAIDWYRLEQRSENIGISQSAGTTFTVLGANGSALSTSNQGFITLQSLANPGRLKLFTVAANQSFTQAQLGNNLFGVTTAVNITVDMPFFLYAVSNANNGENTITFMISRVPHATVSPAAANIGQSGDTKATTQGSFFSLATITAADYAASPCLCIGSFRMRYSSSLWTVQTLNNSDGIGQYQSGIVFTVPRGQFGAAAAKYFADNGGTAPDDTAATYPYTIERSGFCLSAINFPSVTTAGVGAVILRFANPYVSNFAGQTAQGFLLNAGTYSYLTTSLSVGSSLTPASPSGIVFVNNGGSNVLQNANIALTNQFGMSNRYYISTA